MHTLRNYSKKTMQGYCLTCKGIRQVVKRENEYYCIREIARTPIAAPIDPPRISRGRHEVREQAFISKTDRLTRFYNMAWYDYLLMLDECDYACLICNNSFTKESPPHVDHDHSCCAGKQPWDTSETAHTPVSRPMTTSWVHRGTGTLQ